MALLALLKFHSSPNNSCITRECINKTPAGKNMFKVSRNHQNNIKYLCRRNDVKNSVVLFQCLLAGMLSVFLLKILGVDNHPDQHKETSGEAYKKLSTIAY